MITLFVKTGCAFCTRTIAVLNRHKISYEEKNVSDPAVVEELIALGGKKQAPFLVDGDTMMYESQSIIEYIERKYTNTPPGEKPKPKIHFAKGTDVCPT